MDWSAAVILDRTVPNERDRNRIAAAVGLAFVLGGFLIAVGLGIVVLAVAALAAVLVGGRIGVRTVRAHLDAQRAAATIRGIGERVKPLALTSANHVRTTTTKVVAEAHAAGNRLATQRIAKPRDHHRLQKEALRLNTAGSDARRNGDPQRAGELHLQALEVVRELGDRVAEALTLNNLALALDRTGDGEALELFEQAATILAELGEEQREGEVIANLALAFRRRGYERQALEFLHVALEKLPPSSGAYRQVEEELRDAS